MGVRLPDSTALGARPIPRGDRAIARQDTTAPGRALAEFAQTTDKALTGVIDAETRRDEEDAVLEYRRRLIEWDQQNVHNPETGAASVTGKAAYDLPKALGENFDAFAQEAAKGMPTRRAQKLAQDMATGRREQILTWASGHAAKQRSMVEAGDYEANIQAAQTNALMYPTLAPDEIKNIRELTVRYWSPRIGEKAASAKANILVSDVHEKLITSLISNGEPTTAEGYFKAHASSMTGDAKLAVEQRLKTVTSAVKGEKLGVQLVALYSFENTGKALAAIDATDAAPEVKAAARQFVVSRHAAERSDYTDAQGNSMGAVHQMLYPTKERPALSRAAILSSPEFSTLGEKEKGAALQMIDQKIYADVLRSNATDARAIQALSRHEEELRISQAAAAYTFFEPEKLRNMSRGEIAAKLPELGQYWVAQLMARKDAVGNRDAQDVRIDHDDMLSAMRAAGLDPEELKKAKTGKATLSEVQSRVERALTEAQVKAGVPLPRETKNRIMREEAARTAIVDRWYGSDEVSVLTLTPEQLRKVIIPPDINKRVSDEMAELYKRSGGRLEQYKPTYENKVRYYLTNVKGSITAPTIPDAPR